MKRVIVTGGAGFIGSALVRALIAQTDAVVLNIDLLSYAGSPSRLDDLQAGPRYSFERIDIADQPEIERLFAAFRPDTVLHLAAETHVDRSIDAPARFLHSNIVGTYTLLEVARAYLAADRAAAENFRFVHVSTDEVFGSTNDGFFSETTPYDPRSPYAATKAAADHLARAWCHTFGLPIIITNCSNNFGPFQFPEKLIPLTILRALQGAPIPVYGTGGNIRDWLYVEDHVDALLLIARRAVVGETYNIGARNQRTNLEVVRAICALLDELTPRAGAHEQLITFVPDRPGHDWRYAIDPSRLESKLGWRPQHDFEQALRFTVEWYLANRTWWEPILQGNYGLERLGLSQYTK